VRVWRGQDGSTFYVYLEVNEFDQAGQTLYGGKISRVLRHRSSSSVGNVRGNGDGTGHVDDHSSSGGSDLDEPVYIGNYKVENTIAEGLYGKVKIAIHRLTGQKVPFSFFTLVPRHSTLLTCRVLCVVSGGAEGD
jgi:hypothetical protein